MVKTVKSVPEMLAVVAELELTLFRTVLKSRSTGWLTGVRGGC